MRIFPNHRTKEPKCGPGRLIRAHWASGLLLTSLMITSCISLKPKEQDVTQWRNHMQSLAQSLAVVLPFYLSVEKSPTVDQQKQLLGQIHLLVNTSLQVRESHRPNNDPVLLYFSDKFYQDMTLAEKQLRIGDYQSSRDLTLASLNYCVQCHSRTTADRAHFAPPVAYFSETANQLTAAKYYFALRDFDRSLTEYMSLLQHPPVGLSNSVFHQEVVIPSLTIAIRVKRDPTLAEAILLSAMKNRTYSKALKPTLTQWGQSIRSWKKKPQQEPGNLPNKAQILWQQGLQIAQTGKTNQAALVVWLQSASYAHQFLEEQGKLPQLQVAEMLFLLGQIEERSQLSGMADLREYYYEKCIQTHPHSKVAQRCLAAYRKISSYTTKQESVVLQERIKQRLSHLENLAAVGGPPDLIDAPKSWPELVN